MGKWKYLNWLITIIVVAHMYRYFFVRYHATAGLYVIATAGWVAVAALAYYIYVFRIRQAEQRKKPAVPVEPVHKGPARERPKVVFKKKDDQSK